MERLGPCKASREVFATGVQPQAEALFGSVGAAPSPRAFFALTFFLRALYLHYSLLVSCGLAVPHHWSGD